MGRIKYSNGRLATLIKNNNQYYSITNKGKKLLCHRLVASLFVDNINNYFNIKHLDGNKLNNKDSNLIWVKSL